MPQLNALQVRLDFPLFSDPQGDPQLVYLDNAATTQKPRAVLDCLHETYAYRNANVHRGLYPLAVEATERYEAARARVARFIGAAEPRSIVFTRNTTEAINLVAYAWARRELKAGDEILLSHLEHHSNLVPWQQVAQATGAVLRFIPLARDGRLDLSTLDDLLGSRTRLVAVTMASNALGTITPAGDLVSQAHRHGARILLDAAQAAPHFPVNVAELDCDFLAFSGHKMLGPTGAGVLYGRPELLENMEPFLFGGEMISQVRWESASWNELPWKFEAGTPSFPEAVALAAAIDYLATLGMANVRRHEQTLIGYALEALGRHPDVILYGPCDAADRTGVVSFNLRGVHCHDAAQILASRSIAVRAGHHCCQPLMRLLGVPGTVRASFYIYNTFEDVDRLVEALDHAQEVFRSVATSAR